MAYLPAERTTYRPFAARTALALSERPPASIMHKGQTLTKEEKEEELMGHEILMTRGKDME